MRILPPKEKQGQPSGLARTIALNPFYAKSRGSARRRARRAGSGGRGQRINRRVRRELRGGQSYEALTRISPEMVGTSTRPPPLPMRARRECLPCSSITLGTSVLICPDTASAERWKFALGGTPSSTTPDTVFKSQ